MIGLCIGLAGVVWAQVAASDVTLAWKHSIENIRWEEDYEIRSDGLALIQARIKGSGAGMEVPENAELRDGNWHYQPQLPLLQPLRLGRTPEAGDYELCFQQDCHSLSHWLGPPTTDQPAVELWSCTLGKLERP